MLQTFFDTAVQLGDFFCPPFCGLLTNRRLGFGIGGGVGIIIFSCLCKGEAKLSSCLDICLVFPYRRLNFRPDFAVAGGVGANNGPVGAFGAPEGDDFDGLEGVDNPEGDVG